MACISPVTVFDNTLQWASYRCYKCTKIIYSFSKAPMFCRWLLRMWALFCFCVALSVLLGKHRGRHGNLIAFCHNHRLFYGVVDLEILEDAAAHVLLSCQGQKSLSGLAPIFLFSRNGLNRLLKSSVAHFFFWRFFSLHLIASMRAKPLPLNSSKEFNPRCSSTSLRKFVRFSSTSWL